VEYLGPEWGRLAVEALRSDPRVADAVRGLEVSVLTRITDAPPGRLAWLYAAFDGTRLAEARFGTKADEAEALPEPTFGLAGSYATFVALRNGVVSDKRALLTGQLQLRGNRIAALRYMGPLQGVLAVLDSIECET